MVLVKRPSDLLFGVRFLCYRVILLPVDVEDVILFIPDKEVGLVIGLVMLKRGFSSSFCHLDGRVRVGLLFLWLGLFEGVGRVEVDEFS